MRPNSWSDGVAYEKYMGRWSRLIAAEFVRWLGLPDGGKWLDVGCGTGALGQTILATANPGLVVGCDRSGEYAAFAAAETNHGRARFVQAELQDLPRTEGGFDVAASGLVLNFLPIPLAALAAMAARVRPGGTVAIYVWDYAEGMEMLRSFWDAAAMLDSSASRLDEGVLFPICRPEPLGRVFADAGLHGVQVGPLTVPTVFQHFEDYWIPFLGGQGPAPGYLAGLAAEHRDRLRELIRSRLTLTPQGAIALTARAWAAKGTAP
jgi:SAM-dependent methyltransferase